MNILIESIKKAQTKFVNDRAKEELLIKDWQNKIEKLKELKELEENLLKTRAIFQQAAGLTQQQLEFHISGLVSTALAAIWEDPYEFKVEFVERRGKTEADLLIEKDGLKVKPLDSTGGGEIDVIALALRMAFWSLAKTTRPLLILDEPLKNLSEDLHDKAVEMLKMLTKELNLQIIMVTHIKKLIACGDRIYNFKLVNGVTKVKRVK